MAECQAVRGTGILRFMHSTMSSDQLLISQLLTYGTSVHGESEVVTWAGLDGPPQRRS
jgi:fatty-acyl-CoA synthase